ncbi:MAG TPA: thioredoxin [Clostridiales bacterium]|nr:thioredoxin [Clostridiales bacterium]
MTEKRKNIFATGILCVGVVFVIIGVYRNEVHIVLQKAINICLECIGIG